MEKRQDGAARVASALDNATPVEDIGTPDAHVKNGEAQDFSADGPPPVDGPPDGPGNGPPDGWPDAPPGGPPGDPDPERTARLAACAAHPLTDFGNGLRLLEHHGDDVLFVPRLGWFRWNGRKWEADEDAFLVRCDAQGVAALILEEIPHLELEDFQREALEKARLGARDRRALIARQDKGDTLTDEELARLEVLNTLEAAAIPARKILEKKRTDHRSHAKSSGNSGRISNMITEAAARRRVDVDSLNSDPLVINCENGILRLGQEADEHADAWGASPRAWGAVLEPHTRAAMCTKMMRVGYDPAAVRVVFEAFLKSVMPDPDLRDFLKRWFGYTLTGLTTEQKLAFFYGVGRNGKSTLVDVIAKIMDDYGTTIPIESLTGTEQRKGSEATPDLVRLPGARLVRASEPERGQKMREALVKALTGGEPVMIRRMHQEFVEVTPEFKLTIQGNHRPEIRGGDDGIWRRILMVPWETQVPIEAVDPLLPQKLWAEREGIFAWMVEGALAYLKDGLAIPSSIRAATEDYRMDSEPMRVFLLEECEITASPDDFTLSRDLGDAFNAWLVASGSTVWNKRQVSTKLKFYSETLIAPDGARFGYLKRSDAGYLGIKMPPKTWERIDSHRHEMGRP